MDVKMCDDTRRQDRRPSRSSLRQSSVRSMPQRQRWPVNQGQIDPQSQARGEPSVSSAYEASHARGEAVREMNGFRSLERQESRAGEQRVRLRATAEEVQILVDKTVSTLIDYSDAAELESALGALRMGLTELSSSLDQHVTPTQDVFEQASQRHALGRHSHDEPSPEAIPGFDRQVGPPDDEDAAGSSKFSDADRHPLLTEYISKTSEVNIRRDRLNDTYWSQHDDRVGRERQAEQDNPSPISNTDFETQCAHELQDLKKDYDLAYDEAAQAYAACLNASIQIEILHQPENNLRSNDSRPSRAHPQQPRFGRLAVLSSHGSEIRLTARDPSIASTNRTESVDIIAWIGGVASTGGERDSSSGTEHGSTSRAPTTTDLAGGISALDPFSILQSSARVCPQCGRPTTDASP